MAAITVEVSAQPRAADGFRQQLNGSAKERRKSGLKSDKAEESHMTTGI